MNALTSADGALHSPPRSVLDADARAATLSALPGRTFDLLVVGGGVTGAGIALDAVTRGLSVLLVERDDFASGTSSRSSKLIHGGLRYLEQRNFALVREALRERTLLLTRVAPHLVHPVGFLLPLEHRWQRAYFGAGLALYDAMGGRTPPGVPRHRHLGRSAMLEAAPDLRRDGIVGGIRYFDAQTDDARYVVALLRTAAGHGASVLSRVAVTGFLGERRVEGAVLQDGESGAELEARAAVTVVAAGIWAGDLEGLAQVPRPISIRVSKGVHVLVPRDRLDLRDALILRAGHSVLLVIPWGAHWLIGTTDTEEELDRERPVASQADIDYLLEQLNHVLRHPLRRREVVGVFAGLRPLVDAGNGDTASVSRDHVVREPRPGLVTVAGGKYTTYRVMATAAVDAAARQLGARLAPSRTAELPLLGAEGRDAVRAELARLGVDHGLAERLLGRYGSLAAEVVAELLADPTLATELWGAAPYLGAEVSYAVSHEGALHVDDVLARRTRVSIEARDGGYAAAPLVAELMARQLGWTAARKDAEVKRYRGWLDGERAAARGHVSRAGGNTRAQTRPVREPSAGRQRVTVVKTRYMTDVSVTGGTSRQHVPVSGRRRPRRLPLAELVRSEMREMILNGDWPIGSRLPNETDLCDRYNVSRITLREAVQGLVQDGYLTRRQGSGTYVTRRPTLQNSLDTNFSYTEYLEHANIRAGKRILGAKRAPADAETAGALSLELGSPVVEVRRLRTADGTPVVYSIDSIPADIVAATEDRKALRGSLYRLLAVKGHPVDHGEAVVAPALASRELSELLDIRPKTLLQHLRQIDYDTSDRPVMYSLEWHVTSVFELRVYRRGPGALASAHD